MEHQIIEKDIHVFYVQADSFPEGTLAAFEKLHLHFPFSSERRFFGLSRPEKGQGIVYKAAAEMTSPDEAQKYKLETMVIPRGNYIVKTVYNFMDNILLIGKAFDELLTHPSLDPQGYCVEWYLPNDKDVLCMVRLKE